MPALPGNAEGLHPAPAPGSPAPPGALMGSGHPITHGFHQLLRWDRAPAGVCQLPLVIYTGAEEPDEASTDVDSH